ncbi:MAG TPA: hypothetical protein VFO78_00310 [Candidatus Limnocylindrales bacterium]|nr:hypothetical protein [Candidatus Limnocylindrales bacterium]
MRSLLPALVPAFLPALLALLLVACAPAEPSREPSPSPTPSPVQAAPNPNLVEFEERLDTSTARLGQLVRALGEASAGSPRELELVAGRLAAFAADETAWLEAHAADPCYRDAVEAYRAGLAAIAASAEAFDALATASAPPADEEGRAAGEALAEGSTGLQQAAALALEARAAGRLPS